MNWLPRCTAWVGKFGPRCAYIARYVTAWRLGPLRCKGGCSCDDGRDFHAQTLGNDLICMGAVCTGRRRYRMDMPHGNVKLIPAL